jgi:hypothetical protein
MSSYVYVTNEAFVLLNKLKSTYPQYSQLIDNTEANLSLTLWHQLSEDLVALSEKSELQRGTDLIDLYNGLIFNIESSFNPMKLMMLIQNIIKNYDCKFFDNF